MKCEKCGYFCGWNDEGEPICEYDEGIDGCPFADEMEAAKSSGFDISIDCVRLTQYLRSTMMNTSKRVAEETIKESIHSIVTDTYKQEIQAMTKAAMEKIVIEQVAAFMAGEITIGGGWLEPNRTLTRNDYLSECVQKSLHEKADGNSIRKMCETEAKNQIGTFSEKLKKDINRDLKNLLDEATRQTLTSSVVNLLMANETYQKLSSGMDNLLEAGREI
ncbi:hypothetical protein [uncultured Dysosmobacter sp.]|uniref:hypothetical protein n=1 Tax=uncultured Dysosmobacter sp. TaxID=2591384 RepID=UPI0026384B06|nr:hypothetical protein [uncultured Dysosmobacter sp.]